jgi:signal transduction histidine kinase
MENQHQYFLNCCGMSLLLTSITHDILSPLRYVALTASSINDLVLSGQTGKAAHLGLMIADASNRTSNLLEDMLDYFKIQIYGNPLNIETICLRELIDSKVDMFKGAAEDNDTQIKVVCPTETMVATDYHLLSIIIHNLLDNTCKYTTGGVIVLDAHTNQEGKTELSITNTGTGLSEKMIEFINKHEEQMPEAKNTSDEKRISGLGLFIVKELVKLLAIQISVQQEDKTHFKLVFSSMLQAKN